MSNKIKFKRGDVDDFYEPSDSDGEYTEREKSLLKKVRNGNKRNDEIEKEVMAFDDNDDDDEEQEEDDDEEFQENSDFDEEDTGRDGIPDERAWGKKRRDFYSTDFVDQDYSSYNVDEEQAAEQEEEEARAIQQRLAKQLDEADFTLDVFSAGKKPTKETQQDTKIHLKSDLSDLSHRERVQMFRKDSPEFEGLVADFEQRIQESQTVLEPVLDFFKKKQISSHPIVDFVQTKNDLILTYCSNVAFYLVLKAKRVAIKNHPLVKRLVQMRQLLLQLESKYENIIQPQVEKLLEAISSGEKFEIDTGSPVVEAPKVKKPKLRVVRAMDESLELDEPMDEEEEEEDDEEKSAAQPKKKSGASDSEEEDEQDEEGEEDMGEDDERRQITYQMSKNKGLTPHRKKELRNPRVKHRNKFRKAVIRRKGAVRTVRKETKRYGGEVSGIKASTKKGIKIK